MRSTLRRRGKLATSAVGTLALNIVTTTLNFALALVLARLLGADGYGAFAFAFAWAMVLSSFAGLGLSPLVVRHVAAMNAQKDWPRLRGLLRWVNAVVMGASLATMALAALCGLAAVDDDRMLEPLLLALLVVLPMALIMVRQSAMQGFGRVVLGRVPETIVAPGLFLGLAVAIGLLRDDFSAVWAVALLLGSTSIAFVLGAALLRRTLPAATRHVTARYEWRSWARSAMPLFLLGFVGVVSSQAGTILLGVFADPADTGVFALALRLSAFASFLFVASTYPLMPAVARLHSLGRGEELRDTVHRASRVVFLLSLPVAIGLAVLAEPLLDLFGADFGLGADAVRILIAGELVKVFLGLSGLALVMTGHEDAFARGIIGGAVVGIALSLALIPAFGIVGAAVATAAGTVATHFLLTWQSRRKLGFAGSAWLG